MIPTKPHHRSNSRSRAHPGGSETQRTSPSKSQNGSWQTYDNRGRQSQPKRKDIAPDPLNKPEEYRRGRSRSRSRISVQGTGSVTEQAVQRQEGQYSIGNSNVSLWSPYKPLSSNTITIATRPSVPPSPVPSFYTVPRRLPVQNHPATPAYSIPMHSFLSSPLVHVDHRNSRKRQGASIASIVTSTYGKKALSDEVTSHYRNLAQSEQKLNAVSVNARKVDVVSADVAGNTNYERGSGDINNHNQACESHSLGISKHQPDVDKALVVSSDSDDDAQSAFECLSSAHDFESSKNARFVSCSPTVSSYVDTRPARRLPRDGQRSMIREPTASPEPNNSLGSTSKRGSRSGISAPKHSKENRETENKRDPVTHLLATGNITITPIPTLSTKAVDNIIDTHETNGCLEVKTVEDTTSKTHSITSMRNSLNEQCHDVDNYQGGDEDQASCREVDSLGPISVSTESVKMKSKVHKTQQLDISENIAVAVAVCKPNSDVNHIMDTATTASPHHNMKWDENKVQLPHSEIQALNLDNDYRNKIKRDCSEEDEKFTEMSNEEQVETNDDNLSEDEKFEDLHEDFNEGLEDSGKIKKKQRSWCSIV